MRADSDGPRLVFVRHTESEANVEHRLANRVCRGLSDEGRAQAQLLAARLAVLVPTRIWSSPLPRARETADALGRLMTLEVEESALLREVDVGSLDGRRDNEAWEEYRSVVRGWAAGNRATSFPGGESLDNVRGRMGEFVHGVLSNALPNDVVVAVSHGEFLRAALPSVLHNLEDAASAGWISTGGVVSCVVRDRAFLCDEWDGQH